MSAKGETENTTPQIGIQLYTVRDLTGDETFAGTLKSLAEIGFQGVEFAWKYGGMGPDELADFLESTGLVCCGLHVQLNELLDPDHRVYEYAEALGSPFITTSLCSRVDEWNDLLPQLNGAGRIASDKGLVFTYHNHWQEFGEGKPDAFDRLVEETDPALVELELDIGWAQKAGRDPMSLWHSHGDRIPQIHLRDYDVDQETVCDVGDGFIDLAAVLDQAADLRTHWLIFEQDKYPDSPLESCRVCMERLKQVGAA